MMPGSIRRYGVAALVVLALAAGIAWLASRTEWVEVDVPRAFTGEAADDDLYALKRLLAKTGTRVSERDSLAELPPGDAVLLLRDWTWNVLPERDRTLHEWVEQGGHLVIGAQMLPSASQGPEKWIPVRWETPKRQEKSPKDSAPPAGDSAQQPIPKPASADVPVCIDVTEAEAMAPAYPTLAPPGGAPGSPGEVSSKLSLCARAFFPLVARSGNAAPLWSLGGGASTEVLRVGAGRGDVTVIGIPDLFTNESLLRGDNGLVAAAALQVHPAAAIWLVTGNAALPLLTWLWERAWCVLVLLLLAIALWLWRAWARFGPLEAAIPLGRRSMVEQISGTSEFLLRRAPGALHAAQLRALDEAAAVVVRGYARMAQPARMHAIAALAGLDAAALAAAAGWVASRDAALPRALALMETARRGLRLRAAVKGSGPKEKPNPAKRPDHMQTTKEPA